MTKNNDCQDRRDAIAALVLGELEIPVADEIKKHMDTCRNCRALYQALTEEEEIVRSAFETIGQRSKAIEGNLVAQFGKGSRVSEAISGALPKSQKTKQTHTEPGKWRTIMKSRISQLAAAAVIIIAALISFFQVGTSTPAFAEVIRPFFTARTATFQMTMAVEGAPTQSFDCLYAEPIRMRQTNKEHGAIVISDLQLGRIVTLMPGQKKAMIMEFENMPDDPSGSQFNMFAEIRKRIQEAQNTGNESAEFLGKKKMDGRDVIGYYVQRPGIEITVWADPKTNLPLEMAYTAGPATYTMTDIVFDVELDETLLSLEVPEGYTIRTMQVDASEPTEKDLIEMFRIWAEHMDGNLPSALEMNAVMEFVKAQQKKMKDAGREPSEEDMLELQKTIQKMSRGGMFVQNLPADSDWYYTGKGVKIGDAEKPIFWYRPEDSETYRVIYADLSIREASVSDLPEVPEAEPVWENTSDGQALLDKAIAMGADIPADKRDIVTRMLNLNEKDLIAGLKVFAELSGGRYPSKLDAKSTIKEADGLDTDILRDASEEVKKQKVQDIFFAATYHDKLVREKKDVMYYGDKVTAEDIDEILVRWKVAKGKYRVVCGNLTIQSVTAKELAELERALRAK